MVGELAVTGGGRESGVLPGEVTPRRVGREEDPVVTDPALLDLAQLIERGAARTADRSAAK